MASPLPPLLAQASGTLTRRPLGLVGLRDLRQADESLTPTTWILYDRRTGKRCQMSSYMTREQAEEAIRGYRARDARGGRPDIHDLIPHIGVVESTPETFGSSPGDVVAEPDRHNHVTRDIKPPGECPACDR